MSAKMVKAKWQRLRNDLHWSIFDMEDGFVRWSGYDDANWWEKVSPTDVARTRIGSVTGKRYIINFNTGVVIVSSDAVVP